MILKTLYFTKKQWKRFDLQKQEILTLRYEVILTDYESTKTLLVKILKNLNITSPNGVKNLNRGIEKFKAEFDAWDKTMDEFSESIRKSTSPTNDNSYKLFFGDRDLNYHSTFFGGKK